MTSQRPIYALLLVLALVLAACGSQAKTPEAAPEAAVAKATPAMRASQEQSTSDTMAKDAGVADAMPAESQVDLMAADKMTATPAMETSQADAMAQDQGDEMAAKPMTDTLTMATEQMTDTMSMDKEPVAATDLPAWFSAKLTDVNSGQAFTIADQSGKVVLVETLAVWCSNCLKQQKQVLALHEALGERDDFVSIGLDIDLNESPDQLKGHADRNGFNWVYAVATADVAREIGKLYGNQFLNPPSTPMLIVDRHGEAHPLRFGIKSAEELQAALEPFLNETM